MNIFYKHKKLIFIPFFILFFDLYATKFPIGSNLRLYFFVFEFLMLFFLLIQFFFKKIKHIKLLGGLLVVYFIYLFLLLPFSTSLQLSINFYFRLLITFLVFVNAVYYIRSFIIFKKIVVLLPYLLVINFLFFIYSTYIGLGEPTYRGQKLLVGYQSYASQFVFSISFITTIFFFKYLSKRQKIIGVVINILTLLVLLLIFRRTNFIIIVIGLLILFFNNKQTRKSVVKLFFLIAILSVVFINDIVDIAKENLVRRQRITRVDNYTKEGRYVETFLVYETITKSTITTLFGSGELFNSIRNYGLHTGDEWGNLRPLHNDYARLLFGSGFFGLFLYFLIIYKIFVFPKKRNIIIPEMRAYFVFLMLCLVFCGLSSGLTDLYYRSVLFILIGGCIGVFNNEESIKT